MDGQRRVMVSGQMGCWFWAEASGKELGLPAFEALAATLHGKTDMGHRLEESNIVRVGAVRHGGDRSEHGSKVKRGQLTAVQQGRYGTGPAPYGYRRGDDETKPLLIHDREAEVVRMIFREYLRTKSTGKVVEYLQSKKIRTRKGNRWSRQAVAIILSNRTYRGRVSYGEIETEGLHEPIIEPALFYKVIAIREEKSRRAKDD